MKFITALLVIILLAFSAKSDVVNKIIVNNNDRISLNTIKTYGKITIGNNYTSDDLNNIIRERLKLFEENYENEAAILELKKAMDAAGFPSLTTQSRISNITHCIQKDTSAEIFVDGVLKHRGLK